MMKAIKNVDNKTVCYADEKNKIIEIKRKGRITTIRFLEDGKMKVTNRK